jgi:hypothetical protein
MPRRLAIALTITDMAFLAYWVLSALAAMGLLHLPASLMYDDYNNPRVVAWNWSFLPLDLAFSFSGLGAVMAARRGSPLWQPLALISLIVTIAAGGMAISYWTLLGEFDPSWFLANAALVIWPLAFLPGLICDLSASGLARQ